MNGQDDKLRSALGFAMKAGRLAVGEFAVERALKGGGAKLVAVDGEASSNTKKRWADACGFRGIPLVEIRDLGGAVGKRGRMAAAVTDSNFSNMILKARGSCAEAAEGGAQNVQTTEAMIDD